MAGQPHRTAKRVTDLEARSLQLMFDTSRFAPEHYRKKPNDHDPLNKAWNGAVDRTTDTLFALADLGDLVRQKAGITELGPWARCVAESEESAASSVFDGGGI